MPHTPGHDNTPVDQALEILLNEAPPEGAPTQQVSDFNNLLEQFASSEFADQGIRAAALQFRLPNVKVGVNEEGRLSFSDFDPGEVSPVRTEAFASQRLSTAEQTTIVGEGNEVAVLNVGTGPTLRNQVARSQQFYSTENTNATGLLAKLATIDALEDPAARQRALIDIDSSIELALNDRRLELTEQAGARFNVPDLQRRLQAQEALDRADPRWQEFQHDSDTTATLRTELNRAQQLAIQEADRTYLTDSVALGLNNRRTQSQSLFQAEEERARRGLTPQELLNAAYTNEDKATLQGMFEAANQRIPTAEEAITFANENETVKRVLEGDAIDVAVHAFTPGSADQSIVNNGLLNAEATKVGRARATQRLEALNANFQALRNVLNVEDDELRQFGQLGEQAEVLALREEAQRLTGEFSQATASASERQAFRAQLPRRLMQIARNMTLAGEIDSFMNSNTHDYPIPPDEGLRSIVEEANTKKLAPSWVMGTASAQGLSKQASDYLGAYWVTKSDSIALGSSRDSAAAVMARLQATGLGLSGNTVALPQTNFSRLQQDVLENTAIGNVIQSAPAAVDSVLGAIDPVVSAPSRLINWANAPVEFGE